ncbi:phosphopentomutase [Fusibacter bizertensis]|uniref:Phosphopentomutase n=1 Tax=Fusibacter bizertensis TaxID=1488331 RepID=A0ABT6N9I4_9FIRM|nr:phosphopentomutase [Fusibacter bizertensis]MDH8677068.1 phosphopentomutase [Fusibacter bizertensis]
MNRVILFVLDSVGIGALPDSEKFGDIGVNTLGNIAKSTDDFKIPNLRKLGIGNIDGVDYIEAAPSPIGAYGRSLEASNGKDTTTGHWEIAGLYIEQPFKTYPDGFPKYIIDEFEAKTGRKVLCNKPASGTVVLDELGEEHMKTGNPIVYTSADSVFQIAAHEDVIPLDELYRMCQIARDMLMGDDQVARVIARPFIGEPGNFQRTSNRRDYSIKPFQKTVLDYAKEAGLKVKAVGKIVDIYDGEGITDDVHTKDNMDGVDQTLNYMKADFEGILFTNLVDFDAKFGHRRDVAGYRNAIEEVDARLPELMGAMKANDLMIILADHGNDPAYKGTDHTREYIPLLIFGEQVKAGTNIGTRKTFADVAATVSDILGISSTPYGTSFKNEILK